MTSMRESSIESMNSSNTSPVFSQKNHTALESSPNNLPTPTDIYPLNSPDNNTAPKVKREKKARFQNQLKDLLEDASKYDPAFDYSLPDGYLKSSTRVRKSYKDFYNGRANEAVVDDVDNNSTSKPKQKIPKKRKVTKASNKDIKVKIKKTKASPSPNIVNKSKNSNKVEVKKTRAPVKSRLPKETAPSNVAVLKSINFTNWKSKMTKFSHPFFDIKSLTETAVYSGTPTSSKKLSDISAQTRSKTKIAHENFLPIVKLQSLLFPNYQEEYYINFQNENNTYIPMTEIGKLIEYTAMVYLPKPYSECLKNEIIPKLNSAFDDSNTNMFIEVVEQYNKYILTIPRSEIISHLESLREVPTEFIHDFLHIIYTRSIHPQASKLKHYKAFSNFVYGELLPSFLTDVYNQCNLKSDCVFMDLGSGVGNCVIQAAIEKGCKMSMGCEIMPDASDLTEIQMEELKQRCRLMGISLPPVEFSLRESFVDNEKVNKLISKCDVLLINNFLFDSALNKEVEKILQHAKPGCKIISLKNLRNFGYSINFFDIENVLNRLNVEKFNFNENSVSWTHTSGEYFISTVLSDVDESLFSLDTRFRQTNKQVKYTR